MQHSMSHLFVFYPKYMIIFVRAPPCVFIGQFMWSQIWIIKVLYHQLCQVCQAGALTHCECPDHFMKNK